MSDSPYLRALDHGRELFERSGVDYGAMRRIVELKLTLDRRRALLPNQKVEAEGIPWSFYLTYGVFGIFAGVAILSGAPLFVCANISIGMILFLLAMTMISDYSSVLLDLADRGILLSRPVSRKTVHAARLVHIAFYLVRIVGVLGITPLVAGTVRFGAVFLAIFLIELPLATIFVILGVSILYMAILRFFDGEKLRDIINYFQIALSFVMVIAYQFLGRFMSIAGAGKDIAIRYWHFLLPSSWFAALLALFVEGDRRSGLSLLALMAFAVPAAAALIYRFAVAPYFERNLEKMSAVGGRRPRRRSFVGGPLAVILCRNREERAFFRFFNLLMANDRSLKLRVYPSLGMAIAMPFVMLFAFSTKGSNILLPDLSSGPLYLLLYFVLAFVSVLSIQFRYSESHKAAWLYRAAPVSSPGSIIKAEVKAIVARYVMVVALISSAIFLALVGFRILGDIAIFLVNAVLLTLACVALIPPVLPFSKDVKEAKNEVAFGKAFLMMGLSGGVALIHWGASHLPWGLALNAALSIAAIVVIWKTRIARVSWKSLSR
jgi:hypothetical protein